MTPKNEYISRIKIEDMPSDDMKIVAEGCGIDVAMNLMRNCGGLSLYIPKQPYYKLINRIIAEQKIINPKEIAMAFGVSERYVRGIWQQNKIERKQLHMDFTDEK